MREGERDPIRDLERDCRVDSECAEQSEGGERAADDGHAGPTESKRGGGLARAQRSGASRATGVEGGLLSRARARSLPAAARARRTLELHVEHHAAETREMMLEMSLHNPFLIYRFLNFCCCVLLCVSQLPQLVGFYGKLVLPKLFTIFGITIPKPEAASLNRIAKFVPRKQIFRETCLSLVKY